VGERNRGGDGGREAQKTGVRCKLASGNTIRSSRGVNQRKTNKTQEEERDQIEKRDEGRKIERPVAQLTPKLFDR